MGISEKKMKIVIDNYFHSECNVNTSIRSAFEKGFRIGVGKGLSAQPEQQSFSCGQENDLISRQAAINAADRADYTGLTVEDVKKVTDEVVKELKQLPSAQPEIIRCKDCKHYNAGFECLIEGYGIERNKDWYCADAERRQDG